VQPTSAQSLAIASAQSAELLLDRWTTEISNAGDLREGTAECIVEWHGKRALDIASLARRNPELRAPLCSHTEHIVAEALDAFTSECAMTLGDVLLRRVPVALGACWSPVCSREAVARIAVVMGWDDAQAAYELQGFETERSAFLRKPAAVEGILQAAQTGTV
jgi:glycerol-3-phosphate dehydrogenase